MNNLSQSRPPQKPQPSWAELVISYLTLRKLIGIIGIALPFVLVIGKFLLESPGIESSISAYYYTVMRDVFVGSLCAIATFLIAYRGYARTDNRATNAAGGFALGVALFPTSPEMNPTSQSLQIGSWHLFFAASFFITLAFISLVLFRKSNDPSPTPRKRQRNWVYAACGYVILACIASIVVVNLVSNEAILQLDPVFWLEAIAVIAFGISWLTKGEGLPFLNDR
jgi:hypothetical protein